MQNQTDESAQATERANDRATDRAGRALLLADRLLGPLEWTLTFIGGLLIFGLMIWGMVQIILRTVFAAPIFGYIDFVVVAMVGFCMLAISYVQRIGGHVRMELLISKLKGRPYWLAELFSAACGMFIIAVLIPFSYEHFNRAFELGDSTIDIELSTWPGKLAVPVALSILLMRMTIQFLGYLRMVVQPNLTPVAVPHIKSVEELAAEEIESTS